MPDEIDTFDAAARAKVATCFEQHHAAVYRYAVRRTPNSSAAEEVVADVFAVVWRRHAELPTDPLPWLYGVARNTIANHGRSVRRRQRLVSKIISAERPSSGQGGGVESVADSDAARWALGKLKEADRELLMLIAWEGLDHADAAQTLGCSEAALRIRLSRARARLEQILDRAGWPEDRLRSVAIDREGAEQ